MTPELLQFSINSVIRLYRAGVAASEQAARDAKALFPDLVEQNFNAEVYVNSYFLLDENKDLVEGDEAPYVHLWDASIHQALPNAEAVNDLLIASIKHEVDKDNQTPDPRIQDDDVISGLILVAQWDPKKAPASPWVKVILTAVDIAVEYLGQNPKALGLEEKSERILGAYAKTLGKLLPDNGDFGSNHDLAERLGATFLKAGLVTLTDHPDWIAEQSHVQELLTNSLKPIMDAFPEKPIEEKIAWKKLGESTVAPIIQNAFSTLATHQQAFLGDKFKTDRAIGAVSHEIFSQLAATDLSNTKKLDFLNTAYQSLLTVATDKPELFIGDSDTATHQLAKEMLSSLSAVLTDDDIENDIGRHLASTAISVLGNNAHRFVGDQSSWHKVAADITKDISQEIAQTIKNSNPVRQVFNSEQWLSIGRIIIENIGENPALILSQSSPWKGIVSSITKAMAEDKHLLLSGNDWLKIIAIAAREASLNPARLFKSIGSDTVAEKLISSLLKSASSSFDNHAKESAVLFGATLKEAIVIALGAASGNVQSVQDNLSHIKVLADNINVFVANNSDKYGNKEWLRLFRILIQSVLDGHSPPTLDEEIAEEILTGVAQ